MSNTAGKWTGVIAGVLLFVWGCTDKGVTELPPEAVAELPPEAVRVAAEQVDTLAREFYSEVTERRREVLRTQAEWAAFWDRIYADLSPKPEQPFVDFDDSVVIAVSIGTQLSGGYAIDVDGVYRTSSGLHVEVRETSPGRSCFVTGALTQPVVVVRVPRVDGGIAFVERKSVHECS